MTPMNKPEWFQMAENDGPKPVRTIKRGARIMALIAPLLLLGVGVLVAQSNDGGPASAVETQSPSNQITQNSQANVDSPNTQTTLSTQSTQANPISIKTSSTKTDVIASPAQTQTPVPTSHAIPPSTPSIQKPVAGGDDEGFEGDDD
ncbi:MAG: hypothetical protein D4R50_04555 [Actinomycetales bacterium]|nr:MAG: hypothetical protein D4R50_04555 [Actinomycetales bacterium]